MGVHGSQYRALMHTEWVAYMRGRLAEAGRGCHCDGTGSPGGQRSRVAGPPTGVGGLLLLRRLTPLFAITLAREGIIDYHCAISNDMLGVRACGDALHRDLPPPPPRRAG